MHSEPPIHDRLAWLKAFRDELRAHQPELCALASHEVGKTRFEALTADIMPLLASCSWHLGNARRLLRPRRVRGGGIFGLHLFGLGTRAERRRLPVGRVLVIATWNYPVQLVGVQLVQALMAGNEVVVKPSERAPRTQERLLALAIGCADRIPSMRGRISVRPATREAGRAVLAEERFDHVVFTGSTAVGRAIAEVCAARLVPTTLELSGSDSAIVLADADVKAAARAVFVGFTTNAGQTCMAPRRALVARPVYGAFCDELARLVAGARVATLVDADAAQKAHAAAAAAVAAGGRSLAGALEPANGRSMRPVAVVDCPAEGELFLGRHFGPALAVRAFDSLDEAMELHARSAQHLATSIWTRGSDASVAARVRACGSSLVHLNAVLVPSAHPAVALGGHGASGWGVSRGESGLLALTREVTVTRSGPLAQPPVHEPDERAQRYFSRFLSWPVRPREVPASTAQSTVPHPDHSAGAVAPRGERSEIHA